MEAAMIPLQTDGQILPAVIIGIHLSFVRFDMLDIHLKNRGFVIFVFVFMLFLSVFSRLFLFPNTIYLY